MDFSSIIIAGLGIGLLIFVHELGHFLAARAAGVRVEIFSLGFGPRLWGFFWGGTDFRLSLVPFGGFVMVAGADPGDRRYPPGESLYAKSALQRALFWSGGVIMNVLFALAVFPLVFSAGVSFVAPIVGSVSLGSAAWEAGMAPGDRIVSVQGRKVFSLDNVAVEIALQGHRPVELEFARGDNQHLVIVEPHFDTQSGLYQLGVDASYGEMVLEVPKASTAAAAGLQNGDVLLRMAGSDVKHGHLDIDAMQSGEPLAVLVRRGTETVTATIPSQRAKKDGPARIGVTAMPRRVVGIRLDSKFVATLGLHRGDVLLAVDGRAFLSGDLASAVSESGADAPLRLVLARAGKEVVLQVPATAAQRRELVEAVVLGTDSTLRLYPVAGSPAALAGLLPADLVEAVDDKVVDDWQALKSRVEGSIEGGGESPLRLRVRRLPASAALFFDPVSGDLPLGESVELTITPKRAPVFDYGFNAAAAPLQEEVRATGFVDALGLGAVCSFDLLKQSYVTLKRLITGDVGTQNLGGIIRITQVSYMAAQRGPSWFWYFLALISVNLAFVNLLPVPVLDGGHLLFLLIEKVKGSPVSARVHGYSQIVGLVFVLLLVLFVTYNDILRLL